MDASSTCLVAGSVVYQGSFSQCGLMYMRDMVLGVEVDGTGGEARESIRKTGSRIEHGSYPPVFQMSFLRHLSILAGCRCFHYSTRFILWQSQRGCRP